MKIIEKNNIISLGPVLSLIFIGYKSILKFVKIQTPIKTVLEKPKINFQIHKISACKNFCHQPFNYLHVDDD